ncbi:MAG: hypothetical protein A2X94_02530 [Bdellovibrionales bacterium GWB1_55_8]|nr:MAG: hypothetical protein A2X94_02530 [Bdellovibrionales bacterium GWB1_55_8]
MEMVIDKEILNTFVEETNQLLEELTTIVENLELANHQPGKFPVELMSDFSQRIDRIMGAAKTISMVAPQHPGFIRIGRLAEICKIIGYKAAETQSAQLLPIFAAFWSDTIEVTQNLVNAISDPRKTDEIVRSFPPVLQKRLEWLLSRTNATATQQQPFDQKAEEARKLLKSLGV